ncbi:helix-turn-helix transcriptional regulator [Streptomyces sp. NPDC126499]|uniref:helix-turn-helix transcriptional regulator n=1 Tax=Streptomyces sp. NPDC126499 TaxID=3155314 RepID=UPI0033241EB6
MTAEFGAWIKLLRTQAGLSQAELAGTELSASYISLIEAGKRVPSSQALTLIAQRLGRQVEQLRSVAADSVHQSLELALAEAHWSLEDGTRSGVAELFRRVEQRAEALELSTFAVRARWGMGLALEREERFDEAMRAYHRTLRDLGRSTPGAPTRLEVVSALCRCAVELGEFEWGSALGAPLLRELQDYGGAAAPAVVDIVCSLVWACLHRGEPGHARHLAAAAVSDAELTHDPRVLTRTYRAASQAARDAGHTADALMFVRKALNAVADTHDDLSLGRLLALHGTVLRMEGAAPAAERELERALPLLESRGRRREAGHCRLELARCALARGDGEAAAGQAARAVALLDDASPADRAAALLLGAAARLLCGDPAEARTGCDQAVGLLDGVSGRGRITAHCWAGAAELYAAFGETERALDAWRRGFAALGGGDPLLPGTTGLAV